MQIYLWPPTPVSVTVPPLEFIYNSVSTQVKQDTTIPANNRGLPSLAMFYKDGVEVPVLSDSVTPANNNNLPISATSLPLPTGAATEAKQDSQITLVGAVTETAPATDTASSGLNGRLQRIAQRLTSLIGLLPTSLGQKTSAASLAVVVASDQSAIPVSGPLTDTQLRASAVPISAASLPLPTGAATESTLSTLSGKVANDYGVSTGGVRTASQIGNTTGAADFNFGIVGAQTLRTAAQIGNAAGAADFNSGAAGAQTLRSVLATRHEAAATPLSSRLSDGTDFIDSQALAATQKTVSTLTKMITSLAINLGWDGTTHREFAVDTSGNLKTVRSAGSAEANGGSINNSTQGALAVTVLAPANAVGFIITADVANTEDLYWAVGATASATSGQGLQPGRDTGYIPCGANISIFGATSTPRYNVQWLTRT